MVPQVIIVGADKGGVGKTTVSRALMDYFTVNHREPRAFDTENKVVGGGGVLRRFWPAATVVDLTKSSGMVLVFDTVQTSPLTIIDIRAGLLLDALQTLSNIGFLAKSQAGELKIATLHVTDGSVAALDEIAHVAKMLGNNRYYVVKNHINDRSFFDWSPERAKALGSNIIDIPHLDEYSSEKVDDLGLSFEQFKIRTDSAVLRGYVDHWLNQVYAAFNAAALNSM